jgi:hypothetical protein
MVEEELDRLLRRFGSHVDVAFVSRGAEHAGDIVEVIDVIHSGLDAGLRRERLRDVPSHGHAKPMRFVGDRLDHLG